jgi:folate-binding protein YgfZ
MTGSPPSRPSAPAFPSTFCLIRPRIEDFGRTLGAADLADGFVAAVTDLGLIAVAGEDAATFLHSQLTNDVEHLGASEARLAGYCTPKGRLQATFLMWRDAENIFLQLPRAIQAPLQKRLSMFVLRAKAKLRDATAEAGRDAVLAWAAPRRKPPCANTSPRCPRRRTPRSTMMRHRDPPGDAFGAPRYLWLTSAENAARPCRPARHAALGGNAAWRLSAIHAGVPQVTLPTQDQFVPQMVNYELLGGVNFKKGCYPGQEIVARSQYLGKLKRRTVLASARQRGRARRRRGVRGGRPRPALRHDRQRGAERRRRRRRAGRDQAGRAGWRSAPRCGGGAQLRFRRCRTRSTRSTSEPA